ncbi:MAG: ATP-binding protein [Proteobacteria bacterium]|nr:ATP-binding protein [Pseudomonadota bacterium]
MNDAGMNDSKHQTRAADAVAIDPQNPWLGLFSYSEESRAYFHGRDEEAAELCRRVQRKLLTVLFGQSGLGKTSLLRAGVVPRLRAEGYCPVYVRIDYAPDSPAPSEQIKQAIFRASAEVGAWSRPGSAVEGESLWEFLHHRGDLLRDAGGHTLMPLLIFDQFEEIFTLGQADDAGRQRARQFLEDLADLVENRPPAALEARIEDDDAAAEDFDFARADYRVLIALREDYLAHLESAKAIMPSITQNRMRLARMTGAQALTAVRKPGGKLVSQEIAEAIVRFVAGGSELANAEVEPSLLSLVCRELNTVRQSQHRTEISADLLAGSRDSILSEFYERALADQPAGVRRVVEDLLLTESGYRESVGEERVLKALAEADAPAAALPTLVNRRLLRIEERLDMRRVELTHDVLCGVVLASRNLRHEREARDAAEHQLAQQREREAATRRALVRARQIAAVCAVLMLVAVAGAIFGWINLQRARDAEAMAQKSRGDAEKMVSYLIDDLYAELEPTGRLETLGKLAHMTVAYYDGLPPELVTPKTQLYRAMALTREGAALIESGQTDAGFKLLEQAQAVFEKLQAAGDRSDAVTFGLALSLQKRGRTYLFGGRGTPQQLTRATDLLRPLVYKPNGPRAAKLVYADALNFLSHSQPYAQGVKTCDEARKLMAGIGAMDMSDLDAAASYADIADSESRFLMQLNRLDEAQQLEQQVYAMTEQVLTRRPGDLHSMWNRDFAADQLARIAVRRHDDATAMEYARKTVQIGEDVVRFNPSDLQGWGFWHTGLRIVAEQQFDQGQIGQAIATLHSLFALAQDKRLPSPLGIIAWYQWIPLYNWQAAMGDDAGAAQSVKRYVRDVGLMVATLAPDDTRRQLLADPYTLAIATVQLREGADQAALASATAAIAHTDTIVIPASAFNAMTMRNNILHGMLFVAAQAQLRLGHPAQAEALARRWLVIPDDTRNITDDRLLNRSFAQAILAHALALQNHADEATKALQPALDWYRGELKNGAHDTRFRHDFAYALYVDALAQPATPTGATQRSTDLQDAAAQIAGASEEARKLSDLRHVAGLIAAAQAK